ncbi:hypothetical protein NDI36_28940 [Leptolyngbya boryana FACHB-1624]|uniref:hypothetical protein n=1 Tax=Leptolyngbya sp. FACHB-1624 TaxID=2692802 RepID=UPI0016878946|nr:hypothetical protein [Leptolyngbya sp. FACHB-1624]MBD1856990.1 hypothetical protein [Leptolyngbya sp. FACHB-1624]
MCGEGASVKISPTRSRSSSLEPTRSRLTDFAALEKEYRLGQATAYPMCGRMWGG